MTNFLHSILLLFIPSLLVACGSLPRFSHDDQDAPSIAAAMTGIIIQSSDSSYTSTSIYFYDLAAGKIALLSGGESGDTFVKWLNGKAYLFNRSAGRVSYSTFQPKSGIASRSTEQPTPGKSNYDPIAAAIGPNSELILSMNSGSALVFANSSDSSVLTSITNADTGAASQPFRPADIWVSGSNVFVTHQALDSLFRATGAGRVYTATKDSGTWAIKSTTGSALTITNPVYVSPRTDETAIIGGVCYTSATTKCVSGVDRFNTSTGVTTHLSAWDDTKWYPNGGFTTDLTDDSLLVCVKEKSTQKNVVARYTILDGTVTKLFELTGPGCGGLIADRVSMRIFIGETIDGTSGLITVVDRTGATQATATMTTGISGMTASFD